MDKYDVIFLGYPNRWGSAISDWLRKTPNAVRCLNEVIPGV